MKRIFYVSLLFLAGNIAIAQTCPNGDFENWNSYPYSTPDSGWYNSNLQSISMADTLTVWPVAGYIGQAVHIQTAIIGRDTLQAYIINTSGDPKTGTGGVPYSQQPTSITGYYRYNLVSNDSSLMIIEFKKAGAVISTTQFTFRNASGSISSFTPFTFPLNSIPVVPDSVIIGIASSNVMGTGIQSGSWLEVDQLAFAGTSITQPISGGSFDNWTAQSVDFPVDWQVQTHGNGGSGVTKSTSHYSGYYSAQLATMPSTGVHDLVEAAVITNGYISPNNGPKGGLPYSLTSDTLTGYYMYAPVGADTAQINVSLMAAGSIVGGNSHQFFSASAWTYFEMPFSAGSTPDTLRIDIQSGSWNVTTPGSVLNIDYLQLKSQPLPPVGVNQITTLPTNVIVYPNPANDEINFKFNDVVQGPVTITIYDMVGSIIETMNFDIVPSLITLPVGHLPGNIYFYEIRNNGSIIRDRFIKE